MSRTLFALAVCGLFLVAGCPNTTLPTGTDGTEGTTDNPDTGDDANPGDTTDGSTGDGAAGLRISGSIDASSSAKYAPRAQGSTGAFTVIVQSDQTGAVYRGQTDTGGAFEIDLPEDENGNTFLTTILGPDGKAVGPVVVGESGGNGVTGLTVDEPTSLGTIALPTDAHTAPIAPGAEADLEAKLDEDVFTRVDGSGVPIGLATIGKGNDAQTGGAASGHLVDADRDGLINLFDADDDGDGIVDDFETESTDDPPAGLNVNFFMNLKISSEDAATYYSGTVGEIEARLATDTIITFEVMPEAGESRTITAAQLLETPGPTYLPTADLQSDDGGGLTYSTWADVDYAFEDSDDRFEAFVRPNAVMDAGDSFTLEVALSDGTTATYSRMINYVFKNIPTLIQYGPSTGVRNAFDVTDSTVNGTVSKPIPFNDAFDLVLVYEPPLDETGAYVTGMDYSFQIFYEAADDGRQLNHDIDLDATWATVPTGMDNPGHYRVAVEDLTLSASNTYEVTLPKELFPDTVTLNDASIVNVGRYKIDITAEGPTGNAAIMLTFVKE